MDEGLRCLKSYNVEIAELKVTTTQEKAFKLYKKFGFEIFYLWEKASRVSRKKYKDITRISVEYYSYYCMRLHIP